MIVPERSMESVRSSTERVVMFPPRAIPLPPPVDLPTSVTLPAPAVIVVPTSDMPAALAVVLPASSTLPLAVMPSVVSITALLSVMPASPALCEFAKPMPFSTRPPPILTLPPSVLIFFPVATLTLPPARWFVSEVMSTLSLPAVDVMSALMLTLPVAFKERVASPPAVFVMASDTVMELSFGPVRFAV